MSKTPYLTKSSYVRAMTCRRLLWLGWHEPRPYEDPPSGSPAAVGIEIGEKAHHLFPGGVLVSEAPWAHADAVERTAKLMQDPAVPAIFEAAYEADGVRIRADVMERLDHGRWGLREVKSASRVKAAYVDDAAIQAHVLTRLGIDLASIELVHVDTSYVHAGGEIDWHAFFARRDLTEQVRGERFEIEARIAEHLSTLGRDDEPAVPPGLHCPRDCAYWARCTAPKPDDWVFHLPRLSPAKFQALGDAGIERIRDIPETFELTEFQDRMRDVIVAGRPYVSPGLASALAELDGAAAYLDFEAMNPALPVYPGTRPYQRIAFQWSLHRRNHDGELTHADFLGDADHDPRRSFTRALIDALGHSNEPIVVYSAYERGVLNELAGLFPEYAGALEKIIGRLVDLYEIVRGHVYLEGFKGSYSIKTVGKALAPGFSYDGLVDVANGEQAAAAFQRLALGDMAADEALQLRTALLAYCRLDTLAMVEAHRGLNRLVAGETDLT